MSRKFPALVCSAVILVLPLPVAAQAADSSTADLRRVIERLSHFTPIRVSSAGKVWSGRLAAGPTDSLALTNEGRRRVLGLTTIDTLWLRRDKHDGLMAGAGFGALMFALLHLGNGGDRASATRLGAIIFLGASTAGVMVDGASDRWERHYPE